MKNNLMLSFPRKRESSCSIKKMDPRLKHSGMTKFYFCTQIIIICFAFFACSTTSSLRYPPVRWIADTDRIPIQKPKIDKTHKHSQSDEGSSIQIQQMIQLNDQITELSYNTKITSRTEALNTNNFDEVPDSTWFTNRIGRGIINFPKITDEKKRCDPQNSTGNIVGCKFEITHCADSCYKRGKSPYYWNKPC